MRQATVHAVMASGLQHSEDRKQVTDKFSATQLSSGLVRIGYRSPNLLCGLFKALVHEVSRIYNETVSISCARCVKEGQNNCSFNLQWPQSKSELKTIESIGKMNIQGYYFSARLPWEKIKAFIDSYLKIEISPT